MSISSVFSWLGTRLSEASSWASVAAGAAAVGVALQSGAGLVPAVIAGIAAFAGFSISEKTKR